MVPLAATFTDEATPPIVVAMAGAAGVWGGIAVATAWAFARANKWKRNDDRRFRRYIRELEEKERDGKG